MLYYRFQRYNYNHTGLYLWKQQKKEALQAIETLPDDATMKDIMYRLYVIEKIQRGLDAIYRGETVSLEELEREVDSW